MEKAGEQPRHRDGAPSRQPDGPRLLGRSDLPALQKLETAADSTGITLYQANLRTYQLLRYGVPVQIAAGQVHETALRGASARTWRSVDHYAVAKTQVIEHILARARATGG